MKFELNKRYCLRGGGWGMPVYLFSEEHHDYPLLVITKPSLGLSEDDQNLTEDGYFHGPNDPSAYDLLPIPYVEPEQPKKLYAYRNTDGFGPIMYLPIKTLPWGGYTDYEWLPEYDLSFPTENLSAFPVSKDVKPSPLTEEEKVPLDEEDL